MIHFALRKIIRNGRSKVIGIPGYVANALNVQPGDRFAVLYDDERRVITLQPYSPSTMAPDVTINGVRVDTVLMP